MTERRQRVALLLAGAATTLAGAAAGVILLAVLGLNCSGSDASPASDAPLCDDRAFEAVLWIAGLGVVAAPLAGTVVTAAGGRPVWVKAGLGVCAATAVGIGIALNRWA